MTEIRLSTLGDLQDHGYQLDLWCPYCERGATIPVSPLVEKLGRHHSLDVAHVIRCKECKRKNVEARLRAPAPRITDREDW